MNRRLYLGSLLLLLSWGPARAGTVVTMGSVSQFDGPGSAALDVSGQFDYAINFSPSDPVRSVRGLAFQPDNQAIAGATLVGPQQVEPWQSRPEFGANADDDALEEVLQDIRWADSGSGQKLQASLVVTPGLTYKLQILISGNGPENRRWDIRINGQPAVDEITSLGSSPGETYASNRATVYRYEFTAATSPLVVEMGNFFGGNDGGDRNPIWQALTLERVNIPPTPESIALTPSQFFVGQSEFIGEVAVTDLKSDAVHALSLVEGAGSGDNARFRLVQGQLFAGPLGFAGDAPGSTYSIRVRAADIADGERRLEKVFSLTLAAPHAPSAVRLDANSLGAGLVAGQLAARIFAVDEDLVDRHAFALVAGEGGADNALFQIVGNELKLAVPLPAGVSRVSLRLRATDLAGLTAETVLVLPLVEPRVRLNEVLAVSTAATLPLDQNRQPQDWIELYNELSQPVNLSGWHLTDDPANLTKWTFPQAPIAPQGFLLVFASGTGAVTASGVIHTNFQLGQGGERLLLVRPDGQIADEILPPTLYPNTTWGRDPTGLELGYLRRPTPAAPNAVLAAAGRNEVSFSVPHGFATAAFRLALSASVPGSVIRYTLDGRVPTTASPIYAGPINITPVTGTAQSGIRIVRAYADHPDAAYRPMATQSYIFVNGVAGPKVDGVVGQTTLTNSIRNHTTYGPLMDDALLALPSVSLVINASGGLPYAETESSLELIDPQGKEAGFTIAAGTARSGTSSLSYEKGSMSVRFRGKYGATQLSYPLFGGHPSSARGAATEFQEIRLRSGSHDTHSWLGTAENPPVPFGSNPSLYRSGDAQFVRNIWQEDVHLLMGQPGMHGRLVQLYVNGNYYGMYHILEHPDDDYMGSYFPGTSEDYHYTGGGTTGSLHGTESWSSVWAKLKASLGNFTQAQRWVDMDSLVDYMVLSFYAGNDWDWSTQHNWGAAGPRLPDQGGWKFFPQDVDLSLQDVNADCTDQTVPDGVFQALMAHPDFKVLWRDRVYRHLFNDGLLTPAKASESYRYRLNEIATAVVAETARWQPSSSVGALPWDRDGEWTVEKNYLLNTFFPQRTAKVLSQFKAKGWYPLDVPEMSQRGGAVAAGSQIGLTATAGTVYYTTDGSDPRLAGGGVSPAAKAYQATTGSFVLVEASDGLVGRGARWKYLVAASDPGPSWMAAQYDDGAWPSGQVEAGYGETGQGTDVGIADTDALLAGVQPNVTTYFRHTFQVADPTRFTGLNLRLKRDDGAVVYLNGRELMRSAMAAGQVGFATLGNSGANVSDDGNTWYSQVIPSSQGWLSSGANTLAVEVHNASPSSGDLTFDFELSAVGQVAAQPLAINGPTQVKARARSAAGDWSGINEASFVLLGTRAAATDNLTLSEIHYHPEGDGDAEFLEFLNTSAAPVDLTGVQLHGAVEFVFPVGLVLLPGELVVVVKDAVLFEARYGAASSPWKHDGIRVAGAWTGSLANGGETIEVTAADQSRLYAFAWSDGGDWPGRADGSGSSLELAQPWAAPLTLEKKESYLGAAEQWRPSSEFHGSPGFLGSGPGVGVIINEVLSASLAPAQDFIELFNAGASSQILDGWFLSDTASNYRKYRVPEGTALAPGGYLVLTEAQFNLPGAPGCLTPFSLNSNGDDVFLMEADAAGQLLRFADRVEFGAAPGEMPFGRFPNGTGAFSLGRRVSAGAVNGAALPEYAAWVALAFPPGAGETALSADPDGDGLSNLIEFASHMAPLRSSESPLALEVADAGASLEFSYTVRQGIPGLVVRLEHSVDLRTWDASGADFEILRELPQADGSVRITARLKPRAALGFVRLAVSL